jgi:hypothetical protein
MSTRLAFTWLLLGVTIFFGQGCGATQRTLAQDLAWERWSLCSPQHPAMTLTRIDPDGRVWVTYGGDLRLVFNAWNECMVQALAEQGRRGTALVPPPPVATTLPAGPVEATPRWDIGDEWAFRYERPSGTGTVV